MFLQIRLQARKVARVNRHAQKSPPPNAVLGGGEVKEARYAALGVPTFTGILVLSRRVWNADTISNTPRATRNAPVTTASVTIDVAGRSNMMMPASMDTIPKKISQPRAGVSAGARHQDRGRRSCRSYDQRCRPDGRACR